MTTTIKSTAVNALRPALIKAHETGNRKAIDKKICEAVGVSEFKLSQWSNWTNELRLVIADYVVKKQEKNADKKELAKLRNKIFPAWRKIMKVGEEDAFHPQMFISEFDVDSLVGLCETWIGTSHGSAWTVQSAQMFRKGVEAYLGCRMAANAVLTDEDRDVIRAYEGAEKLIKRKNEELDGKDDNDGNHVAGIRDNVNEVKAKMVSLEKTIAQTTAHINHAEGDLKKFLETMVDGAKADKAKTEKEYQKLTNQQKQAEEAIEKAEKTMLDIAEAYAEAIAKIKEIEE